MTHQTHKSSATGHRRLRVVQGHAQGDTYLSMLSSTAWTFAQSALWNGAHFSVAEVEAAKNNIARYITSRRDRKKAFLSFCERIMLAKLLLSSQDGEQIIPSEWLSKSNRAGFGATYLPYLQIRRMRKSIPRYQRELRALAEAVLEFGEDPTRKNYTFWLGYFGERQATALLELFQVYVSNVVFTN